MELRYQQLMELVRRVGVHAALAQVICDALAPVKLRPTARGKRDLAERLPKYTEQRYGFTADILILIGCHKPQWLMELIREFMMSGDYFGGMQDDAAV